MRGRKPKPANLLVISGSGSGSPKPANSIPTCPAHLSPTGKAEWKRLASEMHRLGIISQLDRAVLAAYCQAYGRWVEAERKLKETPTLIKLPSGYIQPSPWLGIANKSQELMHKFLGELGLSPVSRSRVSKLPHLGPKPWEDPDRPANRYLRPSRAW
jgi:P27 family predicted phage terminase small subunit